MSRLWAGWSLPAELPLVAFLAICSIVLGAIAGLLPWFVTAAAVASFAAIIVSLYWPWVSVVVALAMIFEVIPRAVVPQLPVVGGQLSGYDLLLLLLVVIWIGRALTGFDAGSKRNDEQTGALGAFRWPLLYLASAMLLSALYAKFFARNAAYLSEGRAAIVWLALPLTLAFLEGRSGLTRLRWVSLLFALVIAGYVSLQSLLDVRIMTTARIEQLDESKSDVIRSIAGGGVYLIAFAWFYFIALLFEKTKRKGLHVPAIGLLTLGLAVQFGRGVWIATAIGLLVSAYIHRGMLGTVLTSVIGVGVAMTLFVLLSIAQPPLADALAERAMGIGEQLKSGGTLQWRRVENDEAMKRIAERPLTGVGLGGEYKKVRSSAGTFEIETTYIHNGYLYFPLKFGLFGGFIPFAFITAFFWVALKCHRSVATIEDRCLLAALCGAFSVPVIASVSQPEWVSPQGIAAFAIFMAMISMLLQVNTSTHGSEG
jgi:hypothetical protein